MTVHQGDVRSVLPALPEASVQCVVTSPPYWGLRDYGHNGQIGLESSPGAYVAELVAVFREVRRVLKDDGVVFLNLGDSYFGDSPARKSSAEGFSAEWNPADSRGNGGTRRSAARIGSLKPKDLVGIPWRTAFALQADGWYLRSDIIWAKPNPMPESVRDRPTRSHEYVFLLAKSETYYYDADAIAEPLADSTLLQVAAGYNGQETKNYLDAGAQQPSATKRRILDGIRRRAGNKTRHIPSEGDGTGIRTNHLGRGVPWEDVTGTRNARSVWTITTQPFAEAHFATFPEDLASRCVRAGSREGDTVLDPFAGAGTVGVICARYGRSFVGIELNPAYGVIAERRIAAVMPLLTAEVL